MAKKSGGGGVGAAILIVAIGAIASVPKEVWVAIAVVAVIGFVLYFLSKSGNSSDNSGLPKIDPEIELKPVIRVVVDSPIQRGAYRPGAGTGIVPGLSADSCWVPLGKSARVDGWTLPDGAFYVGTGLADAAGRGIEPSLIDPKLPVLEPGGTTEALDYWPSYSSISPRARGAYLSWLATGRHYPGMDVGYVFLFYYGLERRVLHDVRSGSAVEKELPGIKQEVLRLLEIYGRSSNSFRGYATSFLEFLSLSELSDARAAYDQAAPQPSEHGVMSLRLKLGLGYAAAKGLPLKAEWAYAWFMTDERAQLRTPARRCEAQFREMFLLRYEEMFGQGMKIAPPKTKLKAVYRPASASFAHRTIETTFDDVPDVTMTEAPIRRLQEVADRVMDELEPYSRYIAREDRDRESVHALVLLPTALWPDQNVARLGKWLSESGADRQATAVRFDDLGRHFPGWEEMSRDKVAAFSTALESLGVGMEPDVRWGGPMPEGGSSVVLFPLEKDERSFKPTALYKAAALTLHLGAVVTLADGASEAEEEQLESHLEHSLHLAPGERKRLRAFLKWLILEKPSLTGLKRLVKPLDETQKRGMASFLVSVAQVEGGVSAKEVKALSKIYRLLGLNESELYSHVHAAATEPVTVRTADSPQKRHAIPPKPAPEPAVQLDAAKIAALKRESEAVTTLLAGIFSEESAQATVKPPSELIQVTKPETPFAGLDGEQSSFAKILLARSVWTRTELEDLAEDRGIMLDGTLERINEAALDRFGEPLFDATDPLEMNATVLRSLQGHGEHQTQRA